MWSSTNRYNGVQLLFINALMSRCVAVLCFLVAVLLIVVRQSSGATREQVRECAVFAHCMALCYFLLSPRFVSQRESFTEEALVTPLHDGLVLVRMVATPFDAPPQAASSNTACSVMDQMY